MSAISYGCRDACATPIANEASLTFDTTIGLLTPVSPWVVLNSSNKSFFLDKYDANQVLAIPNAHAEGKLILEKDKLEEIENGLSEISRKRKKKQYTKKVSQFLKEELEVKISLYEDKPISVEIPNQINCKIESTDVALKGQTVSSSYKPATLDNGINIQVPPFIESGDTIIVDTRTIEYVKKI